MKTLIPDRIVYFLVGSLSISTFGTAFLQEQEGTRTKAYWDTSRVATICTGHTRGVKMGDIATLEECAALLVDDISKEGKSLHNIVVPISQAQYDALLSFTFNVGHGNFTRSTLLKKLNKSDYCGAANELHKWTYSLGKVNSGLIARRSREHNLFIAGTIGGCP